MKIHHLSKALVVLPLATGLVLSGCKSNDSKPDQPTQTTAQSDAPAPQAAPAAPQKPVCKDDKATANSKKTKAKKGDKTPPPADDCIPASQATAAAAPAPVQTTSATSPYDLSKNKPVTDSSAVQAGEGTIVKGINDWQGEISGIPAAGSKFAKLKIGMTREQVYSMLGEPSGQGAYVTGKAWIPFYFGSDKVRWEAVYTGQGRLIFSQQAGWASSSFYLTWIIHSANER